VIYLDSCLVIYAIEANGAAATAVLTALERIEERIAASPLVLMECLVGPSDGERELVATYERFYETVETVPLTTPADCSRSSRLSRDMDPRRVQRSSALRSHRCIFNVGRGVHTQPHTTIAATMPLFRRTL
jgi:predicted nucleic acid-binding protein